ncbi:hypothetical protein K4F52_008934 [Lecanicillium sp. MT-2017a]|nr:hypothetical protein K4F52_008934 [Lecanicillium sp. MT-2017a]
MIHKTVTADEWRTARLALLEKEDEYHRLAKEIMEQRRKLPMVPVTKPYTFECPTGKAVTLQDLFHGKSQLIIYHHMFEPASDEGCHGCSFIIANFPDQRHLEDRDTALAVVSRAPSSKIAPYRAKNFPGIPWVSSASCDFSYDFHAAFDENIAPIEQDFLRKDELDAKGIKYSTSGDTPAFLVFKLLDGQVYHTYSTFSGIEDIAATYAFLDMTAAGRQDDSFGPAGFKTPSEYIQAGRESIRL